MHKIFAEMIKKFKPAEVDPDQTRLFLQEQSDLDLQCLPETCLSKQLGSLW